MLFSYPMEHEICSHATVEPSFVISSSCPQHGMSSERGEYEQLIFLHQGPCARSFYVQRLLLVYNPDRHFQSFTHPSRLHAGSYTNTSGSIKSSPLSAQQSLGGSVIICKSRSTEVSNQNSCGDRMSYHLDQPQSRSNSIMNLLKVGLETCSSGGRITVSPFWCDTFSFVQEEPRLRSHSHL